MTTNENRLLELQAETQAAQQAFQQAVVNRLQAQVSADSARDNLKLAHDHENDCRKYLRESTKAFQVEAERVQKMQSIAKLS